MRRERGLVGGRWSCEQGVFVVRMRRPLRMWGRTWRTSQGLGNGGFFTGGGREHPDPAAMRDALFGGRDALTLARRISGPSRRWTMGGGFVSQCPDASRRARLSRLAAKPVAWSARVRKGITIVAPVMGSPMATSQSRHHHARLGVRCDADRRAHATTRRLAFCNGPARSSPGRSAPHPTEPRERRRRFGPRAASRSTV